MIFLKISNASELVASRVGQFVERLTPERIDHSAVEDQVIKEMIKSLALKGLKGEITAVNGVDVEDQRIIFDEGLKVRKHEKF